MKLVVGIIRPERLEAVKQALAAAAVFRLTVSDVLGTAPAAAPATAADAYARGAGAPGEAPPFAVAPARRVKLEVAVNEEFVEPTVRAIARGARTGEPGDGSVLVLPLDEVIRIRTGERGPEAI